MVNEEVDEIGKDEEGQWAKYAQYFNADSFWEKLKNYAKIVGCEGIRTALRLYYALDNPDMPKHINGIIWGALGYFVLPVDIIPDILPVVGYTDDLGILAAALGIAALYITSEVKAKADAKLADWFGPDSCKDE